MMIDFSWSVLSTELYLSLSILVIFLAEFFFTDERKKKLIPSIASLSLLAIFIHLLTRSHENSSTLWRSFVQDPLSFYFKVLFLLTGGFVLFMISKSQDKLQKGRDEFVLLFMIALLGMSFVASAGDFVLLFVSLEILTISLYIMTAYLRSQEASIEAGLKYLIMGALSTGVFLYGMSFIYGLTGSTEFNKIGEYLASNPEAAHSTGFMFGMILILSGLGFKIGSFPFQLWIPDVYQGAPTPVTALLAIGSKTAGFAALIRLLLGVFLPLSDRWALLFAILSAITMFYGNLGALWQTNIKRLMGYSSIGHAGYLLMGLSAFSHSGMESVLYYLLAYLFSTAGAFLVIVAVSNLTKAEKISDFKGLSERSPILAAGMMLSLLSLAGVPPLAGFFAKFYIFLNAAQSDLIWLVAVGCLNVIFSLYYYLMVVKAMYLESPVTSSEFQVPLSVKIAQFTSIAGILILGVWQGPFVEWAHRALANTF